jgi:hypothetical protein
VEKALMRRQSSSSETNENSSDSEMADDVVIRDLGVKRRTPQASH